MFVTVKALKERIENQILYMNINMDMVEGKLDNPNNYSRDYMLGVISRQCNELDRLIDELKRISTNKKAIAQCEKKAKVVINRFNGI